MRDRRAKMEALIYTKETSAAKLTLIRYLALVIAAMLPVIILSYLSNMMVWSSYNGMQLDYLAPLKYDFSEKSSYADRNLECYGYYALCLPEYKRSPE